MRVEQILRGRVVVPGGVIEDGIVRIAGGRIAEVRPTGSRRGAETMIDDVPAKVGSTAIFPWILPGFVDMHVHGGGGSSFADGNPDHARAVARFHARHGTTSLLASLVTASRDALREATAALGPLAADGTLAGIHLEGPYLSPARRGAHDPMHLRDPDLAELTDLVELGGVRMVTLAPERPGALTAIRFLTQHGIVAAVGHTDATYEQTVAAIEAGASVGTHVGNAMRPVHQRDPGPIVALIDAAGVVCELIADGVHLHDAMLRHVVASAGPDRIALITDAIATAGMPDGMYDLGGQALAVTSGVARLAAGAIAGSTLTMEEILRRVVHSGIDIAAAAAMASTTPARAIGLDGELGAIRTGLSADLVLLDDELRVIKVLRKGRDHPG